jgi:glycosyltransferase involved in cell wall biosynthesis
MPKTCFIYTDWAHRKDRKYGGVGYYRAVTPAKFLGADIYGEDLKTLGKDSKEMWQNIFEKYDIVVIKQSDAEVPTGMLLFFALYYGKKVVFDFDDNIFEVRPDQAAYKYYAPDKQKRAIVSSALSLCHAIFVSTEPLKKAFQERLKKVYNAEPSIYVLPNCTDATEWPAPAPTRKKVIGYAGSITHNSDLRMIIPALRNVLMAHPDWKFEILGAVTSEDTKVLFKDFPEKTLKQLSFKGGTDSWKGYPDLLASQGWNVGIAPLIDDEFNRAKSHIKWMEYAMCGIPTLASKVYPYAEPIQGTSVIEDGKTGLLFSTPEEFEHKLCALMENGILRDEIASNAKAAVVKDWDYKKHIEKWGRAIEDVCNSPIPPHLPELSNLSKT